MSDHYLEQATAMIETVIANQVSQLVKMHPGLSPIEIGMLHGFSAMCMVFPNFRMGGGMSPKVETEYVASIHIQHPIEKFRADFAIHLSAHTGGRTLNEWFVVECDGYQFHHQTREQVTRDKARERAITAKGYRILRFSGTEIYRDLDNVMAELLRLVNNTYADWRDAK